ITHSLAHSHTRSPPARIMSQYSAETYIAMPKAPFPEPQLSSSEHGSPASSVADLPRAVAGAGADSNDAPSVHDTQLTLRALVSTKEAGVIIGKGGKN
ncbi:hypothetical protein LPJ73_007654, partial [Coemansia sp. RSA 2703]